MWKKIKSRISNPKVITAIVSGILVILVDLGLIDVGMSVQWEKTIEGILTLGIAIGIFGNPDSHNQE